MKNPYEKVLDDLRTAIENDSRGADAVLNELQRINEYVEEEITELEWWMDQEDEDEEEEDEEDDE